MEVKTNLKLFEWQKDLINSVEKYGKGYLHFVKSRRQIGKSLTLQVLLIQAAINKSASTSICLSPTLNQSRKLYQEVSEVLSKANLIEKANEVQLTIRLKNKSYILFKSAEQRNSLRGYTVSGLYVIDESAFIPDDIFYETLAYVNVSQAPIVCVSTPLLKQGFFYNYYCLGFEQGNKILSYDWSTYDTSILLSNDKLEELKKTMPYNKFRTEFLGQFLNSDGTLFKGYEECLNDDVELNGEYHIGIDWASGTNQDDTAIAIFNSLKQMVALYHFNSLDETQTINEIIKITKLFPPKKIKVEINSIGRVFCGLLEKALQSNGIKTTLIKFTTTNESKEQLINKFQVALQNKEITILNDEYLKLQLDMYQMRLSQTNKRTYNAANGYKDDCIIATLLAFDCLNKGSYALR